MIIGILPNVNPTGQNRDVNSEIGARLRTGRSSKKQKKDGDKVEVAMLKDARQLGFVFQDIEPPEYTSILRKSTKVLGPLRRVCFSKATLSHANIRENKGPSLGKIRVKVPHQRSLYALKFEGGD